MEVSQELVDKVRAIFIPNLRSLVEAEVNGDIARGKFHLSGSEYVEDVPHMTSISAEAGLNQLCYIHFYQGILDGKYKGLEGLGIDDFLSLRKQNLLTAEVTKKFDYQVPPAIDFDGQIKLRKYKKWDNIYVAIWDFSFNDKSAVGEVKITLKKQI